MGVDGEGCTIAADLTDSGEADARVGISMLKEIEGSIAQFTADGACDTPLCRRRWAHRVWPTSGS